MSDKLTPEQIAAIRGRWEGVRYEGPTTSEDGFDHVDLDDTHSVGWDIEGTSDCCDKHLFRLALAPTDIAALLAHIAALEAELAAARHDLAVLEAAMDNSDAVCREQREQLAAARAENARLRKELTALRFAGYDVANLACYSDEPSEYTISRDLLDHFRRVLDGKDTANE